MPALLLGLLVWSLLILYSAQRRLNKEKEIVNSMPRDPSIGISGQTYAALALETGLRTNTAPGDFLPYLDWIQLSRYLAGIFVFVGLLGTVAGIAGVVSSLSGLGPSAAGDAAEQLRSAKEGLLSMLGEMRGAFNSTLTGILFTVIVSALNTAYASKARKIEVLLDSQWRNRLQFMDQQEAQAASAPVESVEDVTDSIKESVKQLRDVSKSLRADLTMMSEQMTAVRDGLGALGQKVREDLPAAALEFKTSIDGAGSNFYTNVEKAAKDLYSKTTTGADEAAKAIVTGSSSAGDDLVDAGREAAESLSSSTEAIASLANQLSATGTALDARYAAMQDAIERSRQAAESLPMAAQQMSASVRDLKTELISDRAKANLELERVADRLEGNEKKLGETLRRFEITLSDMAVSTDQIELHNRLLTLADDMKAYREGVDQDLATRNNHQTKLEQTIKSIPQPVDPTAKLEAIDRAVEALENQLQRTARDVSNLEPRLRGLDKLDKLDKVERGVQMVRRDVKAVHEEVKAKQPLIRNILDVLTGQRVKGGRDVDSGSGTDNDGSGIGT